MAADALTGRSPPPPTTPKRIDRQMRWFDTRTVLSRRPATAALFTLALALVFLLAPTSGLADKQASNSTKELALKIKGWHCDG